MKSIAIELSIILKLYSLKMNFIKNTNLRMEQNKSNILNLVQYVILSITFYGQYSNLFYLCIKNQNLVFGTVCFIIWG